MEEKTINGKTYRLVTVRKRTKWVASDGELLNPYRRQESKVSLNQDGYLVSGGSTPVHLYVAHGWVDGYFPGAEVNHKDFNRLNNDYKNLEWVTHSENVKYSVKNNSEVWNKSRQGVHNGRATFTEKEIKYIRKLYDDGYKVADIVKEFYPELKTSKQYKSIHSTFRNICKRVTWKNI